jgi:ATP-dependent DNA ligase
MQKTYPILYSLTSTGAIQTWRLEQAGNKYRTISGQDDGKKITLAWTECEGKNLGKINETSPEEQATLEINAKYKKQLKLKYYKSKNKLGGTKYIQPMLAKKFFDYENDVNYPLSVDRKYNGMRQVTHSKGAFTRKGEAIVSAPHVFNSLKHLFEKYPSLVIDGELYNHEYRYKLNEIIRLVRDTVHITAESLAESEQKVKYYVYDGYGFEGITQETPFLERRKALRKILKGVKYITLVEHETAKDKNELFEIYDSFLKDGYEGAIIRTNDAYENKRSKNLLKLKPTDDDEFEIADIEEGEGNRTGRAGRLICKMKDGRTFAADLKGSFEQFTEVLKNKKNYIGKVVTLYYNGFTGYGIPNYAKFDCNNYNKGDR